MKKSELFNLFVEKVCEVCEVFRGDLIRGCRRQNVVDARMILVQNLKKMGLSCDDIAFNISRENNGDLSPKAVKLKSKGIDRLFNCYRQRVLESYAFASMARELESFRLAQMDITENKPSTN